MLSTVRIICVYDVPNIFCFYFLQNTFTTLMRSVDVCIIPTPKNALFQTFVYCIAVVVHQQRPADLYRAETAKIFGGHGVLVFVAVIVGGLFVIVIIPVLL